MGIYMGIDIGAVSINGVAGDEGGIILYEHPYLRHFGRVEERCSEVLGAFFQRLNPEEIRSVSFTGNHGRKIAEAKGLFFEFESIAQIVGTLHVMPGVRSIISMGGQDTALYQIRYGNDSSWELEYFSTNGPCASGTGSFIDQQAQRLSVSMYEEKVSKDFEEIDKVLKDFIELGLKSQKPCNVACRCTVFTKSDMIHLQNKGERLEDIIYGLHLG
ncbi:MAG: BadF/BadG/BcrA/BcrD ATPase family protein, partial [Desulfatiglandales bacterium]